MEAKTPFRPLACLAVAYQARLLLATTHRFWMQGMNKSLGFIRTCQAGLAAPEPMPEPIKVEAWEVLGFT